MSKWLNPQIYTLISPQINRTSQSNPTIIGPITNQVIPLIFKIWIILFGWSINRRNICVKAPHKSQIDKQHITDGKRKLLIDPYNFDIDTYEELERAELFLKKERVKAENYIINNDKEE